MNKIFFSVCAVLLIAVTLSVGGVFATFKYAQGNASSDTKEINKQLNEFVYGNYPPGFTSELQEIVAVAQNNETYRLNAPNASAGMNKAIVLSWIGGRTNYGYVGTMDNAYGNDVYGETVIENVSMVLSFTKEVDGVNTIYLYFVKKSKAELSAMNDGDILENVFRATFIRDITKNKWVLKERADGLPDVTKGYSPVRPYEGQSDGTKTFGYHANAEIWRKD